MNGKRGCGKLRRIVSRYRIVGLDTNIFIYYFNGRSSFYSQALQLLETITQNQINTVSSMLTLAELLSFKAPDSALKQLEEELFLMPNLRLLEVDRNISRKAATIRREYQFKLPDAVQLATAVSAKAKVFITNDHRLKSFKKLKIIPLKDLA